MVECSFFFFFFLVAHPAVSSVNTLQNVASQLLLWAQACFMSYRLKSVQPS